MASQSDQTSNNGVQSNHGNCQRQLSDNRWPTSNHILFENSSSKTYNQICFRPYLGTRGRHQHNRRLFLAQVTRERPIPLDDTYRDFAHHIKELLDSIPKDELLCYTVTIRPGVFCFNSKRFLFRKEYPMNDFYDLLTRKIPLNNENYYFPSRENQAITDDHLRSSFINIKPISQTQKFVSELTKYEFRVQKEKHVFRLYLQSEDKQNHICVIDPESNYSIVEFSKDFQRTSNIDFIRDRRKSKFRQSETYDDVFDFRVQFQNNPRTHHDAIEYELHQQFPSLDANFRNEYILQPLDSSSENMTEFRILEQLCPYVQFIRRDFGDVYEYQGTEPVFENFTIFLESSSEYQINRQQGLCRREVDSYGLVYARLDLKTLIQNNTINDDELAWKLWDMGVGLTDIAGKCTTPETQQATNYYTQNGAIYTAEDEALVNKILKHPQFLYILGFNKHHGRPTDEAVRDSYNRIVSQLDSKWSLIRLGLAARDKLQNMYREYFPDENY